MLTVDTAKAFAALNDALADRPSGSPLEARRERYDRIHDRGDGASATGAARLSGSRSSM